MILVIGGVAAGKRNYVKQALGYSDEDIAAAALTDKPVVYDTQELLREAPRQVLLPLLLQKPVVVCNEVGCGVVPMEEAERLWREEVGRLCCSLAKEATAVVRLCCGIPTILKGTL